MSKECLLVEKYPVIAYMMSQYFIETELLDTTLSTVGPFSEMNLLLSQKSFCMLIIGVKRKDLTSLDWLLEITARFPELPILIYSEKPHLLPKNKLYKIGIKGIFDMNASKHEICDTIGRVFHKDFYFIKSFI
jgi:DNA-binding NtrC family response regulator